MIFRGIVDRVIEGRQAGSNYGMFDDEGLPRTRPIAQGKLVDQYDNMALTH